MAIKLRYATIMTLTLCVLWFTFGLCASFLRFSPLLMQENLLMKYADRTIGDLNRGASTLANCEYFKRTYPKLFRELIKIKPVYFGYDPFNPILIDAYAVTYASERVILLSDLFFEETDTMRESIMAHELMHVMGLIHGPGDMSDPPIRRRDPIYFTITTCFGSEY